MNNTVLPRGRAPHNPILLRRMARTARRAVLLSRAAMIHSTGPVVDKKRTFRGALFSRRRSILVVLIVCMALVAGYIAVDAWIVSNRSEKKGGLSATSSSDQRQAAEGSDHSVLPANSLANYKVAASLPRALYIDKINVAARVLPMDVNIDSSIQAPINIFDAGWYTGSVKPGEVGAVFIDGHSSGATHQGLFGNLDKVSVGDIIQIERGDGIRLIYKVVKTETVDLIDVDMERALSPYGKAARGLNLMTCVGNWDNKDQTMDKRLIIFAEQVES